jgi:small multidrug resistance family-3 protein
MRTFIVYAFAAVAEIGGCFSCSAWLRGGKSPFWLAPAIVFLMLFAYLLTLVGSDAAGGPRRHSAASASRRPCCGSGRW